MTTDSEREASRTGATGVEEELRQIYRILQTLSDCNQVVMRATDEPQLLQDICQIISGLGEYPLVWIGFAEPDPAKTVRPMAWAGADGGFGDLLNITWDDTERGHGPVGTAIRTGNCCIVSDIRKDKKSVPWRESAARRDYASVVALPLIGQDRVLGALSLYSKTPNAFHGRELDLLTKLAGNLTFGILSVRARAEQNRMGICVERLSRMKEELLGVDTLRDELRLITDHVVDILGADFARIWITEKGDCCDLACPHAAVTEGPHVCLNRSRCLHLMASSGRYTSTEGSHRRVPIGCYKIGRVAGGQEPGFVTNDVTRDPRVHNHEWAQSIGLVSFAGYRLLSPKNEPIGVLALFSQKPIGSAEELLLKDIANTTSQVIVTGTAREGLRKSEERYRTLFYGVPVGVYRTAADGQILDANPAMVQLLGYPDRQTLLAVKATDLYVDPRERQRWRQIIDRDGVSRDFEVRMWRYDRSVIWVQNDGQAFRDHENRVLYYEGSLVNVTQRRQTQDALRSSEERYRQFFENDLTADFIARGDGTVTMSNPAYLKLFGFRSSEEAHAKHLAELFPDKTKYEAFLALLNERRSLSYHELTLRHQDGRPVFAIANVYGFFDDANKMEAIQGYIFDETPRKILEEQFLQSQKMEAVGKLAGGVAHDFNNMLSVIIGVADMVMQGLRPMDPLRRHMETILRASSRSADITRQLLAFARKQIVEPKPLDLNQAISSMQTMLGRLIGEDIDLRFVPGENLWNVRIDPTQLDQILANLAVNARDAIEDVGTITIETANMSFGENYCQSHVEIVPGDYVLLAFSDTGRGMDRVTQERVFEPFFTTKPEGEGTGLGLSTVYGIVKQNNGFISVYGEIGQGTTFKVYLPRYLGTVETAERKKEPGTLAGNETILVVEDEQQILDLVKTGLSAMGYNVLAAGSADEAIALNAKHKGEIHLLLTDVVMPSMNGNELRERILRTRPLIKVIFMSGYTTSTVSHRGIVKDGLTFVQKPFTLRTLAAEVRTVLNGRQA